MTDTGARYVDALAAKDTEALVALFAADVLFRGMTPGRFWEAHSPNEVVQQVNRDHDPVAERLGQADPYVAQFCMCRAGARVGSVDGARCDDDDGRFLQHPDVGIVGVRAR